MSMGFYRYRIATDEEVKNFLNNYDTNDDYEYPWLLDYSKYYHKSYKKIRDKYNLLVIKNSDVFLKLVEIKDKYLQYGYPMKSKWYKQYHTNIIFDDVEKFKKYCYKYMDFKYPQASNIFHEICANFKNGEFIEISY